MSDTDKELVARLRGTRRGLCSEDPNQYSATLSVAECQKIADYLDRLTAENKLLRADNARRQEWITALINENKKLREELSKSTGPVGKEVW